MGFLSHLFPVSPFPTGEDDRPTDRQPGRMNEGSPKTWCRRPRTASSCQSSPAASFLPSPSLPPSAAAKKSLSNDNLGVFCYLEDGEGSGNSLQSYERAELNLAAEKTDFLGQRE